MLIKVDWSQFESALGRQFILVVADMPLFLCQMLWIFKDLKAEVLLVQLNWMNEIDIFKIQIRAFFGERDGVNKRSVHDVDDDDILLVSERDDLAKLW